MAIFSLIGLFGIIKRHLYTILTIIIVTFVSCIFVWTRGIIFIVINEYKSPLEKEATGEILLLMFIKCKFYFFNYINFKIFTFFF